MKKLEKILLVIAGIAAVMKVFFIPGGGFLLIMSMATLAMIYYPFGFAFFNDIRLRHIFKKSSYKGVPGKRIVGAIGAGMVLSVLCMGILFDIQNYPGTSAQQLIGMGFGIVVLAVALIKYFGTHDQYYKRIFMRLITGILITFLLYFIPEIHFIKIQFRNHPEYIKAYENFSSVPYSDSLHQIMLDERWKAYDKELGYPSGVEDEN